MKAISLWQPWATLIAIGAKQIETRGWPTRHRGPLAIHASQTWKRDTGRLCLQEPFSSLLLPLGFSDISRRGCGLPFGAIVAVCTVYDSCPIEAVAGGCMWRNGNRLPLPDEPERSFGDYRPGRHAWLLKDIRRLAKPVPFKGEQGFFDVPDDLLAGAELVDVDQEQPAVAIRKSAIPGGVA